MPGQTIEDIARAEAVFLETVIARHPEAEGKPCVIGNRQAGWAMMMVNAPPGAFRPDHHRRLAALLLGRRAGEEPDALFKGLLGGSWLTALTGDLGGGDFDGAWLVQNFENQNLANTLWTKQYNVWSKIDTEAERYLGFEKYWAASCSSTPRRCNGSSTSSSSATTSPRARSAPPTAPPSTCAISAP